MTSKIEFQLAKNRDNSEQDLQSYQKYIQLKKNFNQAKVMEFHKKWGVAVECYASIGSGHFNLREDKLMDVNHHHPYRHVWTPNEVFSQV